MGLMTDRGGPSDEYEVVALPTAQGAASLSPGAAVFLRRSARPSRRAVLHLHDLTGSFAPADLVRWYNERGFHFYVTDLDVREPQDGGGRRRQARSWQSCFGALDAACQHLRQADGIDAIILSAQHAGAAAAAQWCDARGTACPVDALILASPDFGKAARGRLDIACPVLVISARPAPQAGRDRAARRAARGAGAIRLGQHVTWLYLDEEPAAACTGPQAQQAWPAGAPLSAQLSPQRRRLFDEMGRWLGAYMYGQVRYQLL